MFAKKCLSSCLTQLNYVLTIWCKGCILSYVACRYQYTAFLFAKIKLNCHIQIFAKDFGKVLKCSICAWLFRLLAGLQLWYQPRRIFRLKPFNPFGCFCCKNVSKKTAMESKLFIQCKIQLWVHLQYNAIFGATPVYQVRPSYCFLSSVERVNQNWLRRPCKYFLVVVSKD